MPIKPPSQLFRVDYIDVTKIEREAEPISPEPMIKYLDKEIIKVEEKIVYKEDPKLLLQLNKILKENGELKQALNKLPKAHEEVVAPINNWMPKLPEIEKTPQTKIIEKFSDLKEVDKIKGLIGYYKTELMISASSFLSGGLLCYLILK